LDKRLIPARISPEKLESVAKKFKLSRDKLKAILQELEDFSGKEK
jgi:hypothetical protein